MNSYQAAFMNLDPDGPQYISSNTLDEQSHAAFLNAYLEVLGAPAVNFAGIVVSVGYDGPALLQRATQPLHRFGCRTRRSR
jgi:hypothetical protein